MVETIEALAMNATTGTLMLLAMTCHELYQAILSRLCKRIEECVPRPFNRQAIYMMLCPHNCDRNQRTPFVQSNTQHRRKDVVDVRCTHCLYCFRTRFELLPSSTWGMIPAHEVQVASIMKRLGARHTLLTRHPTTHS
jgi:hypothetical protein